jgi:hypothetical protein
MIVERIITKKETGEVYAVLGTEFDTTNPEAPKVNFTTEIGVISFSNEGLSGNLLNNEYTVTEVDNSIAEETV